MNATVIEPEPIELCNHPYPYQAAFTLASDIDSASISRFRAVHALFSGRGVIKEGSQEWRVLGLSHQSARFDEGQGGVRGYGFELSDSFFMVGDPTTFGMYRYSGESRQFLDDAQDGEDCHKLIKEWIKAGQIDSFHAFLHYTRRQVEPLLNGFYKWCESQNVPKPRVWLNHSSANTPTGLSPASLQPNCLQRLARVSARNIAGPFFGRKRLPLRYIRAGYDGAKPGSPYYVNDLLSANGLRYVWLNLGDLHRNEIGLPQREQRGRKTILQPITMDDGVRYWRFERCFPWQPGKESYLRDSSQGLDASHLLTDANLQILCETGGTCILYTHWTHHRSMPLAEETLLRFEKLRRWHDEGKIWVTSTSKLLEWTRLRTFLNIRFHRESSRLVVEMDGIEDPIFGHEPVRLENLHGLTFRVRQPQTLVTVTVGGQALNPSQICRTGDLFWLDARDSLRGDSVSPEQDTDQPAGMPPITRQESQ